MAGNTSHKIMVILSSVRDGRHGLKVGNAVINKLKDLPIESELLGKFLIVFVLFSTLFKKNYTFFYIQWRKTAKLEFSVGPGYPNTRLPEGTRPFFSYPEPTFQIYLLPGTDPDPSSLPGGYPKGN